MTDRTDQPTADVAAAALRALATLIETYGKSFVPPRPGPGGLLMLTALAWVEPEIAPAIVAAMTVTNHTDVPQGNERRRSWQGTLLGLRLNLNELYRPEDDEPPAAAQPEPTPAPDAAGWLDCGHRADYASAAEHDRDCPAHGTDPAAAADELPAGTVAHWPINAPSIPRQRQRRTWLDRGIPAPGESAWARTGLAAVLREPTASLPPHARGLVPMTDPALQGRTDEVA